MFYKTGHSFHKRQSVSCSGSCPLNEEITLKMINKIIMLDNLQLLMNSILSFVLIYFFSSPVYQEQSVEMKSCQLVTYIELFIIGIWSLTAVGMLLFCDLLLGLGRSPLHLCMYICLHDLYIVCGIVINTNVLAPHMGRWLLLPITRIQVHHKVTG